MGDWQPIQTAPRDGTPIIVSDGRQVFAAAYNPNGSGERPDPDYEWGLLDDLAEVNGWMDNEHGPTHWMPLPNPPSTPDNKDKPNA